MSSSRARVAIVACRASPDAAATDLYPDEDWPLLWAASESAGVEAVALAWDDDHVDWRRVDVAVVRSTWDSVDRPHEYLAWTRATSQVTTLLNPLAAIEWNLDKTYLRRLEALGVPVIPTRWVVDDAAWVAPPGEFVVKPSVSGGGRQTARYRPGEAAVAEAHVRHLVACGHTAMVQEYLPSVEVDGGVKLVFINGEFSHAVRAGPLLDAGVGVVDRLWEKPVSLTTTMPTAGQVAAAETVLAAVDAELACPLLYARVDLIETPRRGPLLAEVDLIDPSLMLRLAPAAAERLAHAIVTHAL